MSLVNAQNRFLRYLIHQDIHYKKSNQYNHIVVEAMGGSGDNDEEKAAKLLKLIDALEESDDVQKVFGNYELSEEIFNKLSN